MKHIFSKLAAAICCFFVTTFFANAQGWTPVGSAGFSTIPVTSAGIAIDSAGTPYVCYTDISDSGGYVSVMKYAGGTWQLVGAPAFSCGPVKDLQIKIAPSGMPFVAFRNTDTRKPVVMAFNGVNWFTVGGGPVSSDNLWSLSFTISPSGVPYVSYFKDADFRPVVMSFDGFGWVDMNSIGIADTHTYCTNITTNSAGDLYMACGISASGGGPAVKRFDGTNWNNVGSLGSPIGSYYMNIAIGSDDMPVLAYADWNNGYKATAIKYNGSSWSALGTPFSSDSCYMADIVAGPAGTYYALYRDYNNYTRTTINKFDGASWSVFPLPASDNAFTTLALDPWGTPYIAYPDSTAGSKVSVQKIGWPAAVSNTTKSLGAYLFPNPNNGSFTLNVPGRGTEVAHVDIVNVSGVIVDKFDVPANTEVAMHLKLAEGYYLLKYRSGTASETLPVIIQ